LCFSSLPHLMPNLCLHELFWSFIIKLNIVKIWKQMPRNQKYSLKHSSPKIVHEKCMQLPTSKHTNTPKTPSERRFQYSFCGCIHSNLLNLPPQISLGPISSSTFHQFTLKQLDIACIHHHQCLENTCWNLDNHILLWRLAT